MVARDKHTSVSKQLRKHTTPDQSKQKHHPLQHAVLGGEQGHKGWFKREQGWVERGNEQELVMVMRSSLAR